MSNANAEQANVPAGYEQILSPLDYPRLELTPGEAVEATVIDKTEQVFEKKDGDETAVFLLLETASGTYRFNESASTKKFVREVQVGQQVYIKFVGEERTGKASPMKRYLTGIKR